MVTKIPCSGWESGKIDVQGTVGGGKMDTQGVGKKWPEIDTQNQGL